MESIIPIFDITGINHNRYPGVKSRYFAGDATLMNCNLFELSGILSREDTRQQAWGIPRAPPSTTAANCVYNMPTQPPLIGRPAPRPNQPPAQTSAMDYPPPMEVHCKCIAAMMREDKYCQGCHFNK